MNWFILVVAFLMPDGTLHMEKHKFPDGCPPVEVVQEMVDEMIEKKVVVSGQAMCFNVEKYLGQLVER